MKKRIILSLCLVVIVGGLFAGCDVSEQSTDVQQKEQTEQVMKQMNQQVGMPNITNFYEKKMAKKIFELRDDSTLITYAYVKNLNGRFTYLGKCMGYGLPYSVQYTNPEKIEYKYNGGYGTLPQADPNGLFMPGGLSATWLMVLDEATGKQSIMYVESELTVTQTKMPKRLVEPWSLTKNY